MFQWLPSPDADEAGVIAETLKYGPCSFFSMWSLPLKELFMNSFDNTAAGVVPCCLRIYVSHITKNQTLSLIFVIFFDFSVFESTGLLKLRNCRMFFLALIIRCCYGY